MTELAEELSRRYTLVINAELGRLERRQPELTPGQLAVVERALADLADRLLLDALRNHPELSGRLEPLFHPAQRPDNRRLQRD
jgi:hypothetical protein